MSPFDYLNSINDTKIDIMKDEADERAYNSFMVNRSLSYFPDTVALANELNRYHHLDKKLQYHFLLNIIRKRKRFSKWIKADVVADIDVVKQYYGYSNNKARQVLSLLSEDQLNTLRQKVSRGGK
jgi:hypothetical protein